MATDADELRAALRGDEDLLRLARGISLSSRFHVYLLACSTPRVADAALEILAEEVAKEREEGARWVRLDPYRGRAEAGEPIRFEELVEGVLAKLVDPAPEERVAEVIHVVDASRALAPDDEAWGLLFQRMNERRNVIAGALGGPLLLVLPQRLEAAFAHEAPDFWSIRTLGVVVRGPGGEGGGQGAGALQARWDGARELDPGSEEVAAEIEAGIASARTRITDRPDDVEAVVALIVWLERRVQYERARGALERALAAAEEAVALERRWFERIPESPESMYDLAFSLGLVGLVYADRGELELAQSAYDESLTLRGKLVEHDPDRTLWSRSLSASLESLGDVHLRRKELDLALERFNESLALTRRIIEKDPANTEWLRDLSVGLIKIGDTQWDRGELELSLDAYSESVSLQRRLLDRDPESSLRVYDLSIGLQKVGAVQLLRGEIDPAVAAQSESLEFARRLLARDPQHPLWRHHFGLCLVRQAQLAESTQRLEEALGWWRRALSELEAVTRSPDAPSRWRKQVAACRADIARLEAALASTAAPPHPARPRPSNHVRPGAEPGAGGAGPEAGGGDSDGSGGTAGEWPKT